MSLPRQELGFSPGSCTPKVSHLVSAGISVLISFLAFMECRAVGGSEQSQAEGGSGVCLASAVLLLAKHLAILCLTGQTQGLETYVLFPTLLYTSSVTFSK